MAVACTKTSEYPIVDWIKKHHLHFNFIRAFILDYNKKPLTHDQRAFMQQFRDSAAFSFLIRFTLLGLPNPMNQALS